MMFLQQVLTSVRAQMQASPQLKIVVCLQLHILDLILVKETSGSKTMMRIL